MLKGLTSKLIRRRRRLIVDGKDLTKTIMKLNEHKVHRIKVRDYKNSKDEYYDFKWSIKFKTSDYRWSLLIEELEIKRIWKDQILTVKEDGIYSY